MTEGISLTLDCRGMRCPRPVIELARHISEVDVGSMIAVIADDPAAAADIPAWCRMRGHAYVRAKNHEDDAKSYVISRRY